MSNEIDGLIIHCCDCGGNYVLDDFASDLTTPVIKCPHCGRNGRIVEECKR